MRFQQEFSKFHAVAEAALRDATKGREGFESFEAADDALRTLENRMNELDRALVEIHRAIVNSREEA